LKLLNHNDFCTGQILKIIILNFLFCLERPERRKLVVVGDGAAGKTSILWQISKVK